ncbi:hypothetical protein CBS101457_006923 [Exobasidium rhododendri]|nr:hypothetical protein CBS101457_006923 [Exobasidium rhododendri]
MNYYAFHGGNNGKMEVEGTGGACANCAGKQAERDECLRAFHAFESCFTDFASSAQVLRETLQDGQRAQRHSLVPSSMVSPAMSHFDDSRLNDTAAIPNRALQQFTAHLPSEPTQRAAGLHNLNSSVSSLLFPNNNNNNNNNNNTSHKHLNNSWSSASGSLDNYDAQSHSFDPDSKAYYASELTASRSVSDASRMLLSTQGSTYSHAASPSGQSKGGCCSESGSVNHSKSIDSSLPLLPRTAAVDNSLAMQHRLSAPLASSTRVPSNAYPSNTSTMPVADNMSSINEIDWSQFKGDETKCCLGLFQCDTQGNVIIPSV